MSMRSEQWAACKSVEDQELVRLARRGAREAEEALVYRYSRLVRQLARPLYLAGGDNDDLIQEGLIGLIHAIREYDREKSASFRTYAEICIRSRLYNAIRAAARDKHSPLNHSVPLEVPFFDSYTAFSQPFQPDPEDVIIGRENARNTLRRVRNLLSPLEGRILKYYLDGLTTREIGEAVNRPPKSVDNAVQRVRRKVARYISSGDLSES